jgi:lipopolysaccharide biosynthesis glycosyltransferase
MQNDAINLLVTFDKNYIKPFRVMLKSLAATNPQEIFRIWLLHSGIPEQELHELHEYCSTQRATLSLIQVDRTTFENAPISKQYPQEMYYRLLAPLLLPESIDKVLYIDPDILVINPVRPLWEIDLKENTFAAASHAGLFDVMNDVNRLRLGTEHAYFNSGVILMNLVRARNLVKPDEIFCCVRDHSAELILPDQDVFNYLYGSHTLQVDDEIWNFDARYFSAYLLRSGGQCDMDWVIQNTVFLHFCGKKKPWKASYSGRFAALYKHYMNLTQTY